MLAGNISQLYKIQGTKKIKLIIIGNSLVQQNNINWSNRILGKQALTHINTNIIIDDLLPKIKPDNIPSNNGLSNISIPP